MKSITTAFTPCGTIVNISNLKSLSKIVRAKVAAAPAKTKNSKIAKTPTDLLFCKYSKSGRRAKESFFEAKINNITETAIISPATIIFKSCASKLSGKNPISGLYIVSKTSTSVPAKLAPISPSIVDARNW